MCNGRRSAIAAVLAATVCTLPLPSIAEVDVLELYSTLDGEYQAILLEDDENDAVDRFRGLTFVMHDVNGTSRSFTLTPDRVREPAVVVDGKRRFLVATRQVSSGLRTQAELPDAFLETAGGTLAVFGGASTALPDRSPMTDAIAFEYGVSTPVGVEFLARAAPASVARRHHSRTSSRRCRPPPSCASTSTRAWSLLPRRRPSARRLTSTLDAGAGWERTGKYFRSLDGGNAYGVDDSPRVPLLPAAAAWRHAFLLRVRR